MISLSNRSTLLPSDAGPSTPTAAARQQSSHSVPGTVIDRAPTPTTPISRFHQHEPIVSNSSSRNSVSTTTTTIPAAKTDPNPSPSKKRFQRLRVRSLSRTRVPKERRELQPQPLERGEANVDHAGIMTLPPPSHPTTSALPQSASAARAQDLASPSTPRRRNNSTGNLYAVDRQQSASSILSPSPSPCYQQQRGSLSRASRSTLNLFQDAQRNTMRHLSKSWDSLTRMAEGRSCQIVLLDGKKIEIFVQPKLFSGELLDIVCSHYNLKEKEYFGLANQDETGNFSWLQLDKRVLDPAHDFVLAQKKQKFLVLHFMVKFFVESITHLKDTVTVELLYLQARSLVVKGVIQIEQETAFELAAYGLQAAYGDFIDKETMDEHLKKDPALSAKIMKESASPLYCEERIIDYYKNLKGLLRGNAIVNYMTIIESLSTYGIHYYDVTDKSGGAYLLGISCKGLGQYRTTDKRIPERVFLWKDLGNLLFRDKKFSAEVLEARRVVHALSSINLYEDAADQSFLPSDDLTNAISDPTTQVSVSRRTFAPGQLTVHVWFAASAALAKTIWAMAISQHQFYLELKQAENMTNEQRTPAQVATDLTASVGLYGMFGDGSRNRSGSVCSSYSYRIVRDGSLTSGFASEDSISQMSDTEKKEMFLTARSKKDDLEETLSAKLQRLKDLCIQEAQITGELPPETPLKQGEPVPQVRRRMGTSFELSSNRVNSDLLTREEKELANLEEHFEVQANITKAAEKLMNDAGGKTIAKQRKQAYRKEHAKMKDIEKRLKEMRIALDRDPPSLDCRDVQIISHSSSISSGLGDSSSLQSFNRALPKSPALSLRSSASRSSMSIPDVSSAPPSRSQSNNNFRALMNSNSTAGYTPSNIYQTRNSYRHQQYPTLSPSSVSESPPHSLPSSDSFMMEQRQPSPFAVPPPRVINHKINVEAPPLPTVVTKVTSSQSISVSSSSSSVHHHRPAAVTSPLSGTTTQSQSSPRSASWDRNRIHGVRKSPAIPPSSMGAVDVKYATLENRKSRVRPPQWQETSIDYHRLPAMAPGAGCGGGGGLPNSPSPVCYTAELTKPYEMTDYYKYSNRVRKLSRTTPDGVDGPSVISSNGVTVETHAYPLSPVQTTMAGSGNNLAYRHHPTVHSTSGTASPNGGGSSSSTRSDRTVSPKVQPAVCSQMMFTPARPMQCLPVVLPRSARVGEAQIAWNDEVVRDCVPKMPTIV
ncbi:FERM domain-containing protein 4A [Hypsibius exemplaris]|uniref:FERM domain-containing protein 4A n=1 Tax=Hypsibius exemplaris TaxID=2072580 RepID=A0A1W0X7H0_HYPEX|nr:FERM domain-containing protein 4A [Hypsibius exemplaris]